MQNETAILRARRIGKQLGGHPASGRRGRIKAKSSLDYGYPILLDNEYGYFYGGHAPVRLGKQSLEIPHVSRRAMRGEMEEKRNSNNCERSERRYFRSEALPLKEGIAIGKNKAFFNLNEILCVEPQDFGMPGWEHPIIQKAIRENNHDIYKARDDLVLYFNNRVWLAIAPFIYTKWDGWEKVEFLPQNAEGGKAIIKPEDFGFELIEGVRRALQQTEPRGDRMQFVLEHKEIYIRAGAPVDWEAAEAVINFISTFGVNAYFFSCAGEKGEFVQDVLAGRLDDAMGRINADCPFDNGTASCLVIMAHLNNGDAKTAEAILGKMAARGEDSSSLVKAAGLIAMYYGRNGMQAEAELCFKKVEERTGHISASRLVEWKKRAGLEDAAILSILDYAKGWRGQDRLFGIVSKTNEFEINPGDFELR